MHLIQENSANLTNQGENKKDAPFLILKSNIVWESITTDVFLLSKRIWDTESKSSNLVAVSNPLAARQNNKEENSRDMKFKQREREGLKG